MNENGSHLQSKRPRLCRSARGVRPATIPPLSKGCPNMKRLAASALMVLAFIDQASAADANAGKQVFREQCALCHSAEPNDNGGAQGPSLTNAFGRRAAANSSFSYT